MTMFVRSFGIGAAAAALLLFATCLALSVVADVGQWTGVHIGIGSLTFLDVSRVDGSTTTRFGPAIAVAAVVLGGLNALLGLGLARVAGKQP